MNLSASEIKKKEWLKKKLTDNERLSIIISQEKKDKKWILEKLKMK